MIVLLPRTSQNRMSFVNQSLNHSNYPNYCLDHSHHNNHYLNQPKNRNKCLNHPFDSNPHDRSCCFNHPNDSKRLDHSNYTNQCIYHLNDTNITHTITIVVSIFRKIATDTSIIHTMCSRESCIEYLHFA